MHARLSLLVLLPLALCIACGGDAPSKPDSGQSTSLNPQGTARGADWATGVPGFYTRARRAPRTKAEQDAVNQLEGIGYAGGYEEAPEESGVTLHVAARAHQGLNLFTSGHAPQAILMDMEGAVLHSWRLPFDAIPGAPQDADPMLAGSWRRVHLLADGSLLAIYEGLALVKVDKDSVLQWSFMGKAHHDLDVMPDGRILVLSRESVFRADIDKEQPILEDFISILSADGEEQRRVSLVDCFLNSEYRNLFEKRPRRTGDITHTNTLELLDGRVPLPAFRSGNVLFSQRHTHLIGVVDLETEKVVWAAKGPWIAQHQPTILDNGNMLLFDNGGLQRPVSRVLELDPASLEVHWVYSAKPAPNFFSLYCGSNQRLANGNTLITESCNGRAFEVTHDKRVVWEYLNPHRAGAKGELIAALFEVIRLPADSVSEWIERPK